MIQLYDVQSGTALGAISEDQLRFMLIQLEEESTEDRDYYINVATLDMFERRGAEPELVAILRQALGSREEMDVRWSRS